MPSALLLPPLGEGGEGGSRWLNVNGLPCRATSAPVRCQGDGAAARFGQPTPIPAFLQRGKEKNREKSRFAAGMLCLPVSMMPLSQCLKHKRTDQAEREAVGERAVAPASHRHWPLAAGQRTQGPAKRWPVRAFSSNPLPSPGQLSLVTFFFARKESYPPPGRRSPLNPQKKPLKASRLKTQPCASLSKANIKDRQGTCGKVSSYEKRPCSRSGLSPAPLRPPAEPGWSPPPALPCRDSRG